MKKRISILLLAITLHPFFAYANIDLTLYSSTACPATLNPGDSYDYTIEFINSGGLEIFERHFFIDLNDGKSTGIMIQNELPIQLVLEAGQTITPTPASSRFVVQLTSHLASGSDYWIFYENWNGTDEISNIGLFIDTRDLGGGESGSVTFKVKIDPNVTPANEGLINNQVFVDYHGDNTFIETSNTVCNTLDVLEPNLDLRDNETLKALSGTTVTFDHVLENTGELSDTYEMSAANVLGDDGDFEAITVYYIADNDGLFNDILTTTPTLAPNDLMFIRVEATLPAEATIGENYQFALKAESNHGNFGLGLSDENTNTINIVDDLSDCLNDYTLSGNTAVSCSGETYTLSGSETGVNYYLIDATTKTNLDGPITGTGNAIDFNYTGELLQATLQVAAVTDTNLALDFDGVDDHIFIPHNPSLVTTSGFTIEAWIYPRDITSTTYSNIYRKGSSNPSDVLLMFQDNGTNLTVGGLFNGGYVELDVAINPVDYENQWVHVLAFFDDATNALRLFRNGIEIGNMGITGSADFSSNDPAYIGSFAGTSDFFDGQIDELRVWNYGRWGTEITNGMNNCHSINTSGLVAWYKIDDGTGTTLTDLTPNNNNGVLINMNPISDWVEAEREIVSNSLDVAIDYGSVIYVNKNAIGNNTGNCWQNAFVNLQDALTIANSGQEIWVAQGTYKPDEGMNITSGDRTVAFSMKNEVSILGGFNGTETVKTDRDWKNNTTTLSGDIGITNSSTDNSYQIVFNKNVNRTAVLDGFTIEEGNANGNFTNGRFVNGGGGMYNDANDNSGLVTSPTVYNCTFQNNLGNKGGAIYNDATRGTTDPYFENCVFQNNEAGSGGGAIYQYSNHTNSNADIELVNCKFLHNLTIGSSGGAIYLEAFQNGISATHAGITNCVFLNNNAPNPDTGNGGAIYFLNREDSSTTLTITNSTFRLNSASIAGGAIYGTRTNPNLGTANASMYNSIFWNNNSFDTREISFTVTTTGNPTGATGTIYHCIYDDRNSNTVLQFESDNVYRGLTDGGGNNDGNGFPSSLFFKDDYLIGQSCHPAIDAGDNTAPNLSLSTTDLEGNTRIVNTTIDIGAIEAQSFTTYTDNTIYVDQTATGNNNGTTWQHAFTSIQKALDAGYCLTTPTIKIAQGNYAEGKELTILNPQTIIGSYPLGGGSQDITNNPTVIDGNNAHRVLNATHTTGTLSLEGMTIQNGNNVSTGAGINTVGNLHLNHVKVENNTASSQSASSFGGGIYTQLGTITLTNSQINRNTSSSESGNSWAGGIFTENGNVTLINSQINYNTSSSKSSTSWAGGVYTQIGDITLTNSQINHNISSSEFDQSYGGGMNTFQGSITLINSQIIDNESSAPFTHGGGIFTSNGNNFQNTLSFQNSILWGNTKNTNDSNTFNEYEFQHPVNLTINYSLVKDTNPTGTGNIDATISNFNPFFVDEVNGDFRLQVNSPLIDAGNDSFNTALVDLDNNPRFDGVIDIGPYEFPLTILGTGIFETDTELIVYPNPFDDQIRFSNIQKPTQLNVSLTSGAQFMQLIIQPNQVINTNDWPKGIYIFQLGIRYFKMIKY